MSDFLSHERYQPNLNITVSLRRLRVSTINLSITDLQFQQNQLRLKQESIEQSLILYYKKGYHVRQYEYHYFRTVNIKTNLFFMITDNRLGWNPNKK